MDYEDTVAISTPEGIELELALAGIGSRLIARILDLLIKAALFIAGALILFAVTDEQSFEGTVATVVAILVGFLVFWAYDVLFEAFNAGRTPGKRALGIRVIGEHGEPVSFSMAAVRNVLRLVDEYLTLWLGALISMVRSPRNQRIGDMTAGSLVVKDRPAEAGVEEGISLASLDQLEATSGWDLGAVTAADLATARRFLERRGHLAPHIRDHLAADLAARLRPKIAASESAGSAEQFIELLVAAGSRQR